MWLAGIYFIYSLLVKDKSFYLVYKEDYKSVADALG